MYFLGVDGGGTKTEFLLVDETGRVLARSQKGTIHIRQIGIEEFERRIREGLDELSMQVGEPVSPQNSFFGIPGYGEFREEISGFQKAVESVLKMPFQLENDSVAGWAAATGTRPGINLVMGTGSIAYGRDSSERSVRTGGWGPFCGDEGSAYWLGKKLIEIFCKQSDGRLEKGELYRLVKETLDLKKDFDLIDYVTKELEADRTEIASLSKILYEAAKQGDVDARSAYIQAAREGSSAIRAVVKALDFRKGEIIPVGCSGGVFRAGRWIMEPLKECLEDISGIELVEPMMSPAKGAALMACKLYGLPISEDLLTQWKE